VSWSLAREGGVVTLAHANPPRHTLTAQGVRGLHEALSALELGLLHRVFPAERFAAEVRAFAADLASRAPIALAAAKRAIRRGVELPLVDGLAFEQEEFERSMRSKDAARALRAFLRGERWEWKGE
jgi:enoyl-CoA hydratase